MENENEDLITLDPEDEVVCIGSAVRSTSKPSSSVDTKRSIPKRKVRFADDGDEEGDDIEWIISAKDKQTLRNNGDRSSNLNVFNVEDEIGDCDYSLQIREPYTESNVIDVEQEYLAETDRSRNSKSTNFVNCYDVEDEIETTRVYSSSNLPVNSSTIFVNAIVHADASPSCSSAAALGDDSIQESEIDDYDARMRARFGLDFSISSIETESSNVELNPSADDLSMNSDEMKCDCENEEVIDVEDDSDDDCVVTSMEISACPDSKPNASFNTVANIDLENHQKPKKKIITETVDEIFKRMMPSAVPGALSLFAPDRNCLPQNVRPSKFCYYYFVSSYIVVKEIVKQEFYKFKEQILVAKKSNAPPRCNCISHPLNQNASKLTLLTNPYSLYHKPNCHFAQNSNKNNAARRKGPRRLSYQVSLHRVPQKREGKDFKDWSDIVLRRRLDASCRRNSSNANNWSCDMKDDANSVQHRPFFCKTEPIDSSEMITIKTES